MTNHNSLSYNPGEVRDRANAILTAQGIDPLDASADLWGAACEQARAAMAAPVECIVDFDSDGVTLWDCPCSECKGIRMHAASTEYTSYELAMGFDN